MKTPSCLTGFGLFALALWLAVAGSSHAQLGKPTYTMPPPTPPVSPTVAPDGGKDKTWAMEKRQKKSQEMGVSGGSICHVDPERCLQNPGFPQRDKVKP